MIQDSYELYCNYSFFILHSTFLKKLSIIIPTHKRADLLQRCLEHLENQTIKDQLEVIVVSDGYDPQTAELFVEIPNSPSASSSGPRGKFQIPIRYFEIEKSQQGVARNRGVKAATAPLILFIGDDIFLAADACEKHLLCHSERSRTMAVLGFTTWDPALEITPVMRWLEESGWQFAYPMIEKYIHDFIPEKIQHRFTYTSHISLPTKVARAHPFCEDVTLYGWEDIEWGLRLRNAGMRLFYEPDAKAVHHHQMTLEQSLKRMETLGKSVVSLSKTVPELDRLPQGLKHIAYSIAALFPTMAGKHRRAFLRGIKQGTKNE